MAVAIDPRPVRGGGPARTAQPTDTAVTLDRRHSGSAISVAGGTLWGRFARCAVGPPRCARTDGVAQLRAVPVVSAGCPRRVRWGSVADSEN